MLNLKLIEEQPRWRVAIVATFAKLMGVCIHVEGIPFGSPRKRKPKNRTGLAGASGTGRPVLTVAKVGEGTGI